MYVVKPKRQRRLAALPLGRDGQESTGDFPVAVLVGHELTVVPPAGVRLADRSAGILPHAGLRVDRVILPVTVAAHHGHVLLRGDELPQLVAFVAKRFVGMFSAVAGHGRSHRLGCWHSVFVSCDAPR